MKILKALLLIIIDFAVLYFFYINEMFVSISAPINSIFGTGILSFNVLIVATALLISAFAYGLNLGVLKLPKKHFLITQVTFFVLIVIFVYWMLSRINLNFL